MQLSSAEGLLRLVLQPPDGDAAACALDVFVGEGAEVSADSLRVHRDHLCLCFRLPSGSPLLARPPAPDRAPDGGPPDVRELLCRGCRRTLLPPASGREALLLPTGLWQACAEALACEECAPLGDGHPRARPGRVYVSAQAFLLAPADARPGALDAGADGLVRCAGCGAVVGESQGPPAGGRAEPRRGRRLGLQRAWRQGAACSAAGVLLYKHRTSLPPPPAAPGEPGGGAGAPVLEDALRDFTDAAAVGAQLLALRAEGGHSRFLLLPGFQEAPPAEAESDGAGGGEPLAAAVEVRVVVSELLLSGPRSHASEEGGLANQCEGSVGHPAVRRAAKVYYRGQPGTDVPAGCCLVVVPQASFAAVCDALNGWARTMPPSHLPAPMAASGEARIAWRTSLLPLPPRDCSFGLE